jgi:3-hydroxyanthranilate 3,4-dioxygenase
MITVVGGPNSRTDYHINQGEEFFYQLEGTINLKLIEDGKKIDFPIGPGEIFLLPGNIPHSPQRPADTIGLVIERKRNPGEKDGFMWFCENCGEKLYEEFLPVTSIVRDLPPLFDRFFGDASKCTCKSCGTKKTK